MIVLLTIIYVLACFVLIAVVLLQKGESGNLAVTFGGASTQTVFGARGAASFLSKLTITAAILFVMGALALSVLKSRSGLSVIEQAAPAERPGMPFPLAVEESAPSSEDPATTPFPMEEPGEEETEPPTEP